MATIKLSRSGKGVLFIDDYGNVFISSSVYLRSLLNGTIKSGLILLNRLPDKVSMDRFARSPLYDPGSGEVVQNPSLPGEEREVNVGSKDSLNVSVKKNKELVEQLSADVEV